MTKNFIIWTVVWLLWIPSRASAQSHTGEEHIFNMMVQEAGDLITDWFKAGGFDIYFQSKAAGKVDLLAEKKQKRIRVTIEQHSPLASKVTFYPESGASGDTVMRLRQRLDAYIQLPNKALQPSTVTVPTPVRNHQSAVVCIYAVEKGQEIQLTGFVVDTRGFIVCTGHDLEKGEMVTILLSNGMEIDGVVVKIDLDLDLALLRASIELGEAIPLRDGRFMLNDGDRLFSIACPNGAMANIVQGFVDGPPRRVSGLLLWQAQMHIDPGSSGSPVFDRHGRITAIVKGRYRGSDSIGFLIPFETLLSFLEKY